MGIKKVRIYDAEPGMVLAKPVVVLYSKGRELMSPGSMLEKKHIKRLGQWGIEHIYIETEEEEFDAEVFSESIRFLAKQTYEDAISSLAKLSKNLIDDEKCDVGQVTKAISQILNVISLEQGMLQLLSKIKESEEYIYQHNVDVCVTALILGREMEMSEDDLHTLGAGCLLHDIGLTRYKNSKWDNSMITEAPANIRKHPILGREIAEAIAGIDQGVLDIISQHHEYYDGSGYPAGLKGDDINSLSRIAAIAEAFNTLISPYEPTKKIDPHRAMGLILDPQFERFDPKVMRTFLGNMALYPSGTFVQLNNSMRAVVVASNKDQPLRPRVLVLYAEESQPVKPFQLDLNESSNKTLFIEDVIDAGNIMRSIEHLVQI
ncbi:HD-GYP domain-containing protein [bacterium]